MLTSLKYSDYRYLWLASLFAGGAAWALIVARGWLVYDLSGSSVWVGGVTFAAMAPMFLAPPLAGFLSDKFDRKKVLATLFVIQFIHNLLLAALAISGHITITHIVALSFIDGWARASQMPAAQALLPNLVHKRDLLNAISLNAATLQGSRLVGPALIAPLMVSFGPQGAFVMCTLFYVFSFLLTLRIRTVSVGQMDANISPLGNFLVGIRFVYKHPLVLPLVVTVFFHCCLTMSFESLLPVISQGFFSDGGLGTTYLMMAVGLGALCFILSIAGIQKQQLRGRILLGAAIVSSIAPVTLAMSTTSSMALIGCVLIGGSQATYMTIAGAVVQTAAPDVMRGRVMSVYIWHIGGMMALFNLVNAALADRFGASPVLIITGAAFLAVIFVSMLSRPMRMLYFLGHVQE